MHQKYIIFFGPGDIVNLKTDQSIRKNKIFRVYAYLNKDTLFRFGDTMVCLFCIASVLANLAPLESYS